MVIGMGVHDVHREARARRITAAVLQCRQGRKLGGHNDREGRPSGEPQPCAAIGGRVGGAGATCAKSLGPATRRSAPLFEQAQAGASKGLADRPAGVFSRDTTA